MSQPPYPPPAPQGRPYYPPSSPQRGPQPPHGQQQYPPAPRHGHASAGETSRQYAGPPAPPRQEPARQQQPPAPQPPAAQEPPRRRKKWPFIVGAIVALFVIIGIANGGGSQPGTTPAGAPTVAALPSAAVPAAPAESGTDTITYEVTGDSVSKANNITYVKDSNFGMQQETSTKLPWKKDVEMESGLFTAQPMTLTAQSGSDKSGSITCRILKNGEEVTSSTSSGPYAVVTCSGGLG
jgi:hypothetical protein